MFSGLDSLGTIFEITTMLSKLLDRIEPDNWRVSNPFSDEVANANEVLFSQASLAEKENALRTWISKHQPCFFGRMAASTKAITFCLVEPESVNKGDEYVRDLIGEKHADWGQETYRGTSSAFVLVLISRPLTFARPSAGIVEIAKHLAHLYLNEENVALDTIYHDHAYLEIPNNRRSTFRWKAGVNYFSAHGDGRWWRDHRIPGGIGYSTNSVGHFVKAGQLEKAMSTFDETMGVYPDAVGRQSIATLEKAHEFAMRTIANAHPTESGKATELLPEDPSDSRRCPLHEKADLLHGKNRCEYRGYYHTDHTIPSDYFKDDVLRPPSLTPFDDLDFTYLFQKENNPAFLTMGQGIQIRDEGDYGGFGDIPSEFDPKRLRSVPEEIPLTEIPALRRFAV